MGILVCSKNVAANFFQVFFSKLIISNITKLNILNIQIVHHNKHITIILDDDFLAHTAKYCLHLALSFSHKNVTFFNDSGVTKCVA